MKKLMKKCDLALIGAKNAMNNFMTEERGDTNFISIAIILIVVIVIAIIFIGLGQELGSSLTTKVNELKAKLGI